MASKGRNGDSMLVHMTPGEVHGLQALAMKHGGSLTVNPDTGLPEANFLKSLLPMLAGFALNAFVPGLGSAIGGALGTSAAVGTGIAVGGITGLATGSLSKGLMAGLGAYGGAGLGEGLMSAGAASGAGQALSVEAAKQAALEGITLPADYASLAAKTAMPEQIAAARAAATPGELLAAGAKSAAADPMAFAKANFKPLAAAASPIMADMMVPTTTKAATPMAPGRIREKRWNGQYFEDVASTDAGVYNTSGRNFSDLYRGYNGGGIVALAEGGMPHFDAGGFTQDQINAALKTELAARGNTSQADLTSYAKSQYGLTDAQINAAYDTIPGFNAQGKYDANDYMATHVAGQTSPQMIVDAANAANPFSAQNMAKVDVTRPGQYVQDASGNYVALSANSPGFDINNPTALTYIGELISRGGQDSTSLAFNQIATPQQKAEATRLYGIEKARLDALDVAAGRLPDPNAVKPPTGLAQLDTTTKALNEQSLSKPPTGETEQQRNTRLFTAAGGDWNKAAALRTAEDKALVADPNYWTNKAGLAALDPGASETTKWFAARGLGFDPIDQVIDNFLLKYKPELAAMLPKEQEAAMRAALDKEKLNEADVIKATGKTIAQLAAAKRADGSIIVPGNIKDVPVGALPGGISGAGDTVINANGTITTRPDLTSLTTKDVRDAYTKGGGSLGYTSPVPTSLEDFNAKYVDRMSGDSRAAYDYLTGKAGATYPTKSTVGQIARPYDEAVLGYPARGNLPFTYDKATGKMVRNMDYVAPGRDDRGNVTYTMSLNDIKKSLTDTPLSGQALYDWAQTNKVSAQQIADATDRSLSSVYADFRKGAAAKAAVTNTDGTVDETKVETQIKDNWDEAAYLKAHPSVAEELRTGKSVSGQPVLFTSGYDHYVKYGKAAGWEPTKKAAGGGIMGYAMGGMPGYALGGLGNLGGYSDGGRLLKGPGDGVSDSIPATIGRKQQPARLADGEFVVPARIVSELGNGSTDAGAKKLYAMMDRVQRARGKTTGKNKVAANSRADKYLPA
jgi:hypothetical protein